MPRGSPPDPVALARVLLPVFLGAALAGDPRLVEAAPAIRVDASVGWSAESAPHPSLVATFRHRSGARAAVGVEYLKAGATVDAFVESNLAALRRMRFRVDAPRPRTLDGGPAIEVRSKTPDGRMAQIQVYAVRANKGFVVTLSADPKVLARAEPAFEELLEGVRLP